MPDTNPASDFDAAKKIVDELKDLPKERQERVLRWVSESLGIAVAGIGQLNSQQVTAPPAHGVDPQGGSAPGSSQSQKDIRSFVTEKAPASDNQFAAVVAYYYRFEAAPSARKNTIGGADLQEAARLAGRKRLSNPRQTLKNAKNTGYLDNVGRGEFSINTVGENLVAMTLPGGEVSKSGSKRRSKPQSHSTSSMKRAAKKGR